MVDLRIDLADVGIEPYSAVPTLNFEFSINESTGVKVQAITMRIQIRIEPQGRRYSEAEEARLVELFGAPTQWGDSLKPFQWAQLSHTVGAFTGTTMAKVPMVCTYDFEVASAKYFHGLEDGAVPLLFLFSGTVFSTVNDKLSVELIPWHLEVHHRLPVQLWRDMMDRYFPGGGWVRLNRESIDALMAFKASQGLMTWDQTVEELTKRAEEPR
jgi:hypothetical protein